MGELLENCRLCPRRCGVDRHKARGFCRAGILVEVAKASLHPWEEPCLTGEKGAGAVFFSHCSLGCVYCQNYPISTDGFGIAVTVERLAEIFLEQEERGATTLDLVTPTHYAPQIMTALDIARDNNFSLPVVYNSSGYELVSTIDLLAGYVDVYLPDLKYVSEETSAKYSAAPDYFAYASKALLRMHEQVGAARFDECGIMRRGLLVRHLVLPGRRKESMAALDWLSANFGDAIYVSLMRQYTPMGKTQYKNLSRCLTSFEYDSVVEYALKIGMKNVFVQEKGSATSKYVPNFDGGGV